MKSIEAIISSLRVAMTDARQNESHFESWMILNEAICDAIDALAEQPASKPLTQDMVESCPYDGETLRGAFFDGWLKAEDAHGIKEDA